MKRYEIYEINEIVEFVEDWFPARKGDKAKVLSGKKLSDKDIGIMYCFELIKSGKKIYLHNSESWIINKLNESI